MSETLNPVDNTTGKVLVSVEVTPDDIADGEPGNTGSCPIALALRRQLGPDWTARVEPTAVFFYRRPNRSREFTLAGSSPLEPAASGFVNEYDSYGEIDTDPSYGPGDLACVPEPPQPFKFLLAVPEEALRTTE